MNAVKILIVENELIIAKQLAKYLEKRKYQIIGISRSGEQALELIEEENPDIVLMDIDLDGNLDGVETTNIIHETLIIPIIYLTKYSDQRTLNRVKDTLPATYLTKPFKNHDVKNAIEMAISSLSQLTHHKSNDVNVTLEIQLNHEDKQSDQVFHLKDRIFVKNKSGDFDRLLLENIVYMESDNHTTLIHTPNGTIMVKALLKYFLEILKDYPIIRIHHQFAVNANYVYNISRKEIKLEFIDKTQTPEKLAQIELPISTTYKNKSFNDFRVVLPKNDLSNKIS